MDDMYWDRYPRREPPSAIETYTDTPTGKHMQVPEQNMRIPELMQMLFGPRFVENQRTIEPSEGLINELMRRKAMMEQHTAGFDHKLDRRGRMQEGFAQEIVKKQEPQSPGGQQQLFELLMNHMWRQGLKKPQSYSM